MQISERIEGHVRDAFGAVISRDGDAMVEALKGLTAEDSATAVGLALYVVGFVVNDIHRDGATDEELATLARQITETESDWVQLNPDTVASLLGAASTGDTLLGGVAREDLAGNVFVSAGHLLGAFSGQGQPWHEYLDEIWTALEAEPEPSSS